MANSRQESRYVLKTKLKHGPICHEGVAMACACCGSLRAAGLG
jgi:hypothetical protein